MIVRFRGCSSLHNDLPGGMPQGTLLGVILYILYINPIAFPSEITLEISDIVHEYWKTLNNFPSTTTSSASLPPSVQSVKFMDDATIQEAVNLTTSLIPSDTGSTKVLPKENALLQTQLNLLKQISDAREMTLNNEKTCLLIVNFSVNTNSNHKFRFQAVKRTSIFCLKPNYWVIG